MSIKEFDTRFGITATLEEEKKRFVTRIENTIFPWLLEKLETEEYEKLFRKVCYELGVDPREYSYALPLGGWKRPRFVELTIGDFLKTLRTLVALYYCIHDEYDQLSISMSINHALEKSSVDLGVQWGGKAGVFYPTGEPLLDHELVSTSLNSLGQFENERKDISLALENYQAKRLDGVVENCYLAVEGLSRKILNNGKTLLNNKPELLQTLGFSRYWGNTLSAYIDYANENRRHAGENRHDLEPNEVEAFLYLTCLLIRAIVRAHTEKGG